MSTEQAIMEFVRVELARGKGIGEPMVTDNLINAGLIDSLGVLKLILFLEGQYSVKIVDDDLSPENFESIQTINSLVQRKIAGVTVRT